MMDDYIVGNVADLISGNLTPSRPAHIKRARTPVKHQQSPRVTPRSEAFPGREALLSPTLLRKKAVAKKSPKRIFEQEDLDKTAEEIASPKADRVKKHLQADLSMDMSDSGKSSKSKLVKNVATAAVGTPGTPIKKKKNNKSKQNVDDTLIDQVETHAEEEVKENVNPPDKQKITLLKKKKKNKNKKTKPLTRTDSAEEIASMQDNGDAKETPLKVVLEKKGKKKNKNKKKTKKQFQTTNAQSIVGENVDNEDGSASEHESDNEIDSETEQDVKQILDSGPIEGDDSSDEEKESKKKQKKPKSEKKKEQKAEDNDNAEMEVEEAKRTLFVGNVPLSKKTKKEIKQIFSKYGTIESVRIRAVPVKDMRTNPKVAVIKNEIHPDRTSVNVYVKFSEVSSVSQALFENNRMMGEHHLRVTRSDTSGDVHDPRKTIFVGNIPFGIEDETLRAKFEKCGEIESVRIIRDKASQIGKGFGYVNFASTDGVELALSLTEEDLTIKNRIIRIRRYTQAAPGQKVVSKPQGQKLPFNRGQQGNRGHQETGYQDNRGQGQFGNRGRQDNRGQGQFGNRGRQDNRGQGQFGNRGRQDNRGQGQFGNRSHQDSRGPSHFGNRNHQDNRGQGQFGNRQGYQNNRGEQDSRQGNKGSFNAKPKDESGALRRINKRQSEDVPANSEPPQKRSKIVDQPAKQKKTKKEFVGMTAEKKKKKKFDKGRKQKQILSEILTKKS